MLQIRVIPCLLLKDGSVVKTVKFKNPAYVGDPINIIRIFNEKEVDELIFLDISATVELRKPPFKVIENIASECFMPLTYGGGVRDLDDMRTLFGIGVEKIALNAVAVDQPSFIKQAAEAFGSQSIVVSIDAKKNLLGGYQVYTCGGRQPAGISPVLLARQAEQLGAGEILLTAIDRDGTWCGYDIELTSAVVEAVSIPVIACGGAGSIEDFLAVVNKAGVQAVAAGSMFVYQKQGLGVLVNFPTREQQKLILARA